MSKVPPFFGLFGCLVSLCLVLGLTSCQPDGLFKGKIDMPEEGWALTQKPTFEFEIPDNAAPYQFAYIVRNSMEYPYYNLFIRHTLRNEKKEVLQTKLEELTLFDAKTGKPFGAGLGDLFDHKIVSKSLNRRVPLPPGKYTLELEQFMRQDTLAGVMTVGISVETPKPKSGLLLINN